MAWIWCGADVYDASRSQTCWCSLWQREALPAGSLERASPWRLQPTAMVRVSTRLSAAKLALAAHARLSAGGMLLAKVRVAYGDENPFFAPQVS